MRIASFLSGLIGRFRLLNLGSHFVALLASLFVAVGGAIAYQVQTGSTGAGPISKTYPSGLTATHTIAGANTTIFAASSAFSSVGSPLSTYYSPAIATTTNATELDINAVGCVNTTLRCANRGTLTIAFNKPVTNPVLHLSGLGGNTGTTQSMYHASLNMTSWTATGTPTLTRVGFNSNFTVTGNEIRATTINGGTSCQAATPAGCGSVRINGTITSVTFQIDLLMGGTGANPAAGAVEGINYTVSVDDDYGDAPSSYQTATLATHAVGGAYLGAGVSADSTATVYAAALATSPIASATASSDGNDDGVTFATLIRGQASQIDVAVTGSGGFLQGWIDFAADGNFTTAGDRIATNVQDGGAGDLDGSANGNIRLSVTPTAGAAQTTSYARFRWSTTSGLGLNGAASDGEVEDYQVIFYPQRNDLSLAKTVSNASPSNGSAISYTLTLTSAAANAVTSNTTASGITVQDTLPAGFSFTSATGTGTYNSGTGVWSVGSLAPGASASLTINGTVSAFSGTVTNVAQVSASSVTDSDSTPNNGVTTEDDYASAAFSVSSVLTAPSCSVGATNQIITNGDFSTGSGPSWTGWTADAIWFGTSSAAVNNDTTGGNLTQSGLSGLTFGPSVGNGAVLQLSAWWRNGGPPTGSTSALFRVYVAGTEYARITSDPSAGTSAAVTYYNGASGNLTTITEFTSTGWRINLPTTVAGTGALQFTFTPGGGTSDDYEIDNVALYTCNPSADLSLAKTVSTATPVQGSALSYTLTASSATTSTGTATGITVQDTLPAGFTFTSATGTGTYNSGTGVWTVGSLAPNTSAAITINGTASGTAGVAVTNVAQISASSLFDPDSTVNNGVTTEDDYASVLFTPTPGVINCPTGTTATGSGFATGGTGGFQNQIFWLDWSCGGTTSFPAGATINKSWDAGDGLIVTGQVSNVTDAISAYTTGSWGGDLLDDLYPGVNPIGLRGFADGADPQFRVALTATLNGVPVTLRFVAADAEDTGHANEAMAIATSGTAWTTLEQTGSLSVTFPTTTQASWTDNPDSGGGTVILETQGSSINLDATMTQGGTQAMAFGVLTPFDFSDAPLTGTSYAAANHRTIPAFDLGAAFTNEGAAYDSPAATGDVDDGVTLPASMTAGVPVTMTVAAPNVGYLSAWLDWNDDGDFADAGEQVATDIVNGGAGDTDGAANGVITFNVTPTTGTAQTFARFRLSSRTGAPSSGLHGFGEIEDYQIVILNKAVLTLVKSNALWNDGVNPLFRLPGNDVVYSLTAANTTNGQPDANSVFLYDSLPPEVTFFNGDADGAGAGTNSVNFIDSGSGLTFNYATDVAYSNAASPPANFAACTYSPSAGYDVNVKYVCFNPKGTMAANTGSGSPAFTFSFRTRIK
jgi:uncharacterized repeat protein (TIGR01451 family)